MKFLVFNLVVGTALGYLLLWDGPRLRPDPVGAWTGDTSAVHLPAVGAGAAPADGAPSGRRNAGSVAPDAPLAPASDAAAASAQGLADAAAGRRIGGAVGQATGRVVDRVVDPRPARPLEPGGGRVDPSAERAPAALPTAPDAAPADRSTDPDLGRQLHELARDMEGRFLTGIR